MSSHGVDGVTGPELETLDGVCRRTLASLPTREHLLQDRAPGVLKPSALLRVRMAAAALDKVMDATLEELARVRAEKAELERGIESEIAEIRAAREANERAMASEPVAPG